MVATHIAQPTPKEMQQKMKEQMASQQAARAASGSWVASFKLRYLSYSKPFQPDWWGPSGIDGIDISAWPNPTAANELIVIQNPAWRCVALGKTRTLAEKSACHHRRTSNEWPFETDSMSTDSIAEICFIGIRIGSTKSRCFYGRFRGRSQILGEWRGMRR